MCFNPAAIHSTSLAASFSATGAMTTRTYYSLEACPCSEECSDQAFNRAKIWGWSPAEARERLSRNLQLSEKHLLEKSLADEFAQGAELVEGEHSEQPASQRPRIEVAGRGELPGDGGMAIAQAVAAPSSLHSQVERGRAALAMVASTAATTKA